MKKTFLFVLFIGPILIFACLSPEAAYAYAASDYTVMVSAEVSELPSARITLSWPHVAANTGGYAIYRKNINDTAWGTSVVHVGAGGTSYTDVNVTMGLAYEYKVQIIGGTYGAGYVYAGIRLPAKEQRGKLVLIVDNRHSAALSAELKRFEQDLTGDGWEVLRHDVSINSSTTEIKAVVLEEYNKDPEHVKSVILFGHIPVRRTGGVNPDGHYTRTFPADSYYGDMDGTWDIVNPPLSLPGKVELEVGRVDMYDLPAFAPLTEQDLLKRYLDKNHAYRHGLVSMQRRGLVHDDFPAFNFASNGWGNFPQLCGGAASVTAASKAEDAAYAWKKTLVEEDYLWSYICGGGAFYAVGDGYLRSGDLAATPYKTTFALMFGSFFGEWDVQDNLLRAFLAMPEYGLANVWGARPNWYFHHMGLGATIGYSARISQNNDGLYRFAVSDPFVGAAYTALMGDPTLRLYPVSPPEQVLLRRDFSGNSHLSWDAPEQEVAGYYVYRSEDGAVFERIGGGIVTDTRFTDTAAHGEYVYMVRSTVLEMSASGTFYNLSQGAYAAADMPDAVEASYMEGTGDIRVKGSVSAGDGETVAIKITDLEGSLLYVNQAVSNLYGEFFLDCGLKDLGAGRYRVSMARRGMEIPVVRAFTITEPDLVCEKGITFTDALGNPVPGLTDGEYLQANVELMNYGDAKIDVKAVVALYNAESTLQKVAVAPWQLPGNTKTGIQAGIDVPEGSLGYYVKVFIWDDLNKMQNFGGQNIFPSIGRN